MRTGLTACASAVLLSALCLTVQAQETVMTFEGADGLKHWTVVGDAGLASAPAPRQATALRLGKDSRATILLRGNDGSGKVEFWVYEDAKAPFNPTAYGAGPMWGLLSSDGRVVAVGSIYAPYLNGSQTYAAAAINPEKERPWQQVQYLGGKRAVGWHKWTFDFDPDRGLSLACDDKPLPFDWNKSRFFGFRGLVLFGDATDSGQVLYADDIAVTLGPEPRVKPVWPPPPPAPPAELTVLPPLAPWNPTPYARWKNGPAQTDDYFPIAVWLQSPANASRYREAGINLYIGLWKGPTAEQIEQLKKAGMPVICDLNEYALQHLDEKIIVGWMHGDEPDNAHTFKDYWKEDKERIKEGWPEIYARLGLDKNDYRGYGPPVPPKWIVRDYEEMRRKDPSRPVLLNLGMGVSFDPWHGRGERTGKLEDYPEYLKGCDIASYDIYPASSAEMDLRLWNALWYVPQGIRRLRQWCGDEKPVWMVVGASEGAGTPQQIRNQVWSAIIHGCRGLCYFVHRFRPTFNEHALLDSPAELAMVTSVNRMIAHLAPVLNSPTVPDAVTVSSSNPKTPVHAMVKKKDGATYLFSAAMYCEETQATFRLSGLRGRQTAEVLGEDRTVPVVDGVFVDAFEKDGVHIYRIAAR